MSYNSTEIERNEGKYNNSVPGSAPYLKSSMQNYTKIPVISSTPQHIRNLQRALLAARCYRVSQSLESPSSESLEESNQSHLKVGKEKRANTQNGGGGNQPS